jgi:hypothetical protein
MIRRSVVPVPSNKPLEEKKSVHRGNGLDGTTAFLISQRLINKRTWTEEQAIERQNWLIGQIENVLGVMPLGQPFQPMMGLLAIIWMLDFALGAWSYWE